MYRKLNYDEFKRDITKKCYIFQDAWNLNDSRLSSMLSVIDNCILQNSISEFERDYETHKNEIACPYNCFKECKYSKCLFYVEKTNECKRVLKELEK